jgi:hypothetical protein
MPELAGALVPALRGNAALSATREPASTEIKRTDIRDFPKAEPS